MLKNEVFNIFQRKRRGGVGGNQEIIGNFVADMEIYDVQITTDYGEIQVLQISATSPQEAEMTAISMVNSGEADVVKLINQENQ